MYDNQLLEILNKIILWSRIISDKYCVSCNASGKVQVWDLKAALDRNHTATSPLYQINATTVVQPLLCPIVRADEYQIALIPCRAKDYSELHLVDFLQLDSKVSNSNFISNECGLILTKCD